MVDNGSGLKPEPGHEAVGTRGELGIQADEGYPLCPDQLTGYLVVCWIFVLNIVQLGAADDFALAFNSADYLLRSLMEGIKLYDYFIVWFHDKPPVGKLLNSND